ncbi:MAG: NAD(P)/FAD-dependent oxidoreductase [bacterium]
MSEPEILIIGGGPAGMTAGIYASRAGHTSLILEREITGGQVTKTATVENYPGFAEPVNAFDLVQEMEKQARRFGCRFESGEATLLQPMAPGTVKEPGPEVRWEVQTTIGSYHPRVVIICTGTQPRPLGLKNEKELTGRGISYCAICDGALYRDREVAVIGGGDSALEEAEFLTRFCSRVHLIHRRDQFRAAQIVQNRILANPRITLHLSHIATRINGSQQLESLELKDLKTQRITVLPVAGLFIYAGLVPNTAWCSGVIQLDESGFIITDEELRTSRPGVFAAGDVRKKRLRQIATAVGDGALAATVAHEFLNG